MTEHFDKINYVCEDEFSFYNLASISEDEMIELCIHNQEGAETYNYMYNVSYLEERATAIFECIKELRSEFSRECPEFIKKCEMYQEFWTTFRFAKNMENLLENALDRL
jgi:hypothetical protein